MPYDHLDFVPPALRADGQPARAGARRGHLRDPDRNHPAGRAGPENAVAHAVAHAVGTAHSTGRADPDLAGTNTGHAGAVGEARASGLGFLFAYGAAAPLIVAALIIVAAPAHPVFNAGTSAAFMGLYGALLIVFLAGARWGAAQEFATAGKGALIRAVWPPLIALPLFLPPLMTPAFHTMEGLARGALVIAVMGFMLIEDAATLRGGDVGARITLMTLVAIAFLVALAATLRGV